MYARPSQHNRRPRRADATMANVQNEITPAIAAPHNSRRRPAENEGSSAFLSEQQRADWPAIPERTRPDALRHRAARQRAPVLNSASPSAQPLPPPAASQQSFVDTWSRAAGADRAETWLRDAGGRVGDAAQDAAAAEGRAGQGAEAAARTHRRFTPAMRIPCLTTVHRITRPITQQRELILTHDLIGRLIDRLSSEHSSNMHAAVPDLVNGVISMELLLLAQV
ncbi:hypothetical protein FIBSPDRAFT_1046556 [Athelia psychrophila]|uniref:Uncharacterized protein n=1 Tax=Athelia psychrophila TaxID=1759441 RepID=A0A166GGS9_9AGAM|nr:hypothetical protein FIBSPDRAFT_1046556 [Fibularhizoctonia sp. CBS 109695]